MNRLLIPLALVALLAGCAMPGLFGQQAGEPEAADTAQTIVVREIYHETPVYYVDTVYMAEDPEPVQPVYVQNEYNEYNEYNHTDVYVHQRVVVPPSPPHRKPGWSPREPERRPADRRGNDGSGGDRRRPGSSDEPGKPAPRYPVQKVVLPVGNDRQAAPVPPAPLPKPTPPQRKAPVRDAKVLVTQVGNEIPKQVPAPTVDKPVAPTSDGAQISLGKPARK
jgi:hypothetical protein